MNQLINYKGVCRTALATPSLLEIVILTSKLKNQINIKININFFDAFKKKYSIKIFSNMIYFFLQNFTNLANKFFN